MVSSSTWADRARNANNAKSPTLNVWNARMASAPPRPSQDPSPSRSQSTPTDSPIPVPLSPDADEDPFVVRVPHNRERNPITIPTLDDSEAWPEVGKSSTVKSNKEKDVEHSHPPSIGSKKSEKKWIPLPLEEWQQAPERRPRHHSIKNGHSQPGQHFKNLSATNGSNMQNRAHSGHNSVSQSTTQSRINSRSGSVHSSPRIPRNKRLPHDDSAVPDTNPPPPVNQPVVALHPQSDIQSVSENHASESGHVPIAYPTPLYTPDNTLAPYYSRHPPFSTHQHFRHTSAHSPSNPNTPPLYQPPPPMHYSSAAAPYPIYPPYAPYDYGINSSQSPFLYWNNSPHHPASGEPPQSYPIPGVHFQSHSPHAQALRVPHSGSMHHHSDGPDDQSYIQQSSRIPLPPEQSQAVAGSVPAAALDSDSIQREPMTFGTIAAPESPRPEDGPAGDQIESKLEQVERAMTLVAIGMNEGDMGSVRFRTRTRSVKGSNRTLLTEPSNASGVEVKFVDLTDQETNWKFGFADGELSPPHSEGSLPLSTARATTPRTQESSSAVTPLSSISVSLPFDVALNSSLPTSHAPGIHAPSDAGTDDSDVFKVKDYGYGFGKNAVFDRPSRDRRDKGERDAEREGEGDGDGERSYNRPRRGYDRPGYGRRAGRGGPNGYPRGRAYHGRGGIQPHRPPHPASQIPLTGPHSQFQQLILPMGEHPNGYYSPHQVPPFIPQPYDPYPPAQFPPTPVQLPSNISTPPMPPPRSELPFLLDTTRYWLLGQLEYYLSPQNLAQDFYLRQQMDAKGWIPIATLASFNRVRNLTHDYQTVRDVLVLSTVLTVKDDWVRMHGWERFVLPNAPASVVEFPDTSVPSQHVQGVEGFVEAHPEVDAEDEEEEEEEEEEEVVFVMGKEAGWSPHHRT